MTNGPNQEKAVFLAALERQAPADRAAFLDGACAGDTALRQRVEALLLASDQPDSLLDQPAAPAGDTPDEPTRTVAPEPGGRPAGDTLAFLAAAHEAGSLGRLDHYEILELVGRGGMGIVLKARDTELQRVVAIKVLAPHLAASGTARQRFVREAQAAAAVRDDHVVNIHAVNKDGPVPYLVMEFISGVTLERRVKAGGPLEVKEILRIGMQAARGLAAAHAQGLIHRDVKPANILLENGVQRVKITDFGLARAADDASLTQKGAIAGTPLFMSPEQARGEALDQRSDLFSLGSVLYTLCTGRSAFRANGSMAVMRRVIEDTPPPIREVNPDVPDWLAALILKLLAKDPAHRVQTAAELAGLLGQYLAGLQQPHLTPMPPPPTESARPAPRRRRRVGVVLLLLGCVLAGLAAVAVLGREWLYPPSRGQSESRVPPEDKKPPSPPDDKPKEKERDPVPADPRVLTVSQKPEAGGRFRTIAAALEKVVPGMTVRVLDDADYEEHLLINRPEQYRGVTLEAAGKVTLHRPAHKSSAVLIDGVAGVTLRGFRLEGGPGRSSLIHVTNRCPGLVLDGLELKANLSMGVYLYDVPLAGADAPVVIRNCVLRGATHGVALEGKHPTNYDQAVPCGHVVIRDNILLGCHQSVALVGVVRRVQVVGNRIADARYAAVDLLDLLPGTADILIANNTLWRNETALRICDDHARGKAFLKCKNIRIQNNLVLEPPQKVDMVFVNHTRGDFRSSKAGDLKALAASPEWRFGHNWRATSPPGGSIPFAANWVPPSPLDRLEVKIQVLSREPGHPDFLRPPKDSPLAKAGMDDAALPGYVGAVPPEGVEPWDWEKTWKALAR